MRIQRIMTVLLCIIFITGVVRAGEFEYTVEEHAIDINPNELLKLDMDADVGEVTVHTGADDGQCIVCFKHPESQIKSRVLYKEEKNTLYIHFDKKGWSKPDTGERDEREMILEVTLPTNVKIDFKGKLKAGEVEMNVGGLRLNTFRVSLLAGEMEVNFSEPNQIPMEYLHIDAKIGELSTHKLGNARFKRANVNGGIGEIEVDLTGSLEGEARAKVDLDIGEATLLLPGQIGVRMQIGGLFKWMSSKNIDDAFEKQGGSYYSDNFTEMENTLSLRVTPGLGELNIRCY